jgi:hypothetical protein
MDKDSAAAAGNARPRVVVDLDDEIVQVIFPCEAVGTAAFRHGDVLVVMAVARILAPSVGVFDAADRETGDRPRVAVGAPPQSLQPEYAARGRAVTLPLVGADAATAECHRNRHAINDHDAA